MISGIDIQEMNKSWQPQQERPGGKMKDHIKRGDKIGNALSFVGEAKTNKGEILVSRFPGKEIESHHPNSI